MSKPKVTKEIEPVDTTHELTEGQRTANSPMFVEAERLLERMAEITTEIGHRAFEFFRLRGGEFGRELDDWFNAEREVLRSVLVDMTETDSNVLVTAAVPGFKPEEIEISIKENLLIITGKTETKQRTDEENVVLDEWKSNRFLRQFTLPTPVDPVNATATLKDGILSLTMPKTAAEPKKVAVVAA